MSRPRAMATPLSVSIVLALLATALAPIGPTRADEPVHTDVVELTGAVDGMRDFALSMPASHVAVHWPGSPHAEVSVAFSADGATFGPAIDVEVDEVGAGRRDGRTYGQIMVADGATAARVISDRPLPELELLVLDTTRAEAGGFGFGATASAAVLPPVIPRSGWGADESLRFDAEGDEIWPTAFYPVQKLIVHHTAMGDGDPDPAATVRAIYYYHAVTQGWGDIGYNFLIDAAGRVYEGRYSRPYAPGVSPSADDDRGRGVEAGHARAYNAGSLGVGVLGTFDTTLPTAAARDALVRLLAWASAHHGLNPRGAGDYVNPINGNRLHTATIAGHRDYNPTACPGGHLYAHLPEVRNRVAARLVERVAGADRYATAAAVSATTFAPGISTAFVATGLNFPDALAGGPAAAALGAPILLTHRDFVPAVTVAELQRLAPGRIVVLGGPSAISDAVLGQLGPMAPGGAARLAGPDRYATAAAISNASFAPGVQAAFIATGLNFPDALAAGPAAGARHAPILLTQRDALPAATVDELLRLQPWTIVVLGGTSAVSDGVAAQLQGLARGGVVRVAGADRYATAAAVAAAFFPAAFFGYVATGTNFPDALAGASPGGIRGAPMFLVRPTSVPAPIAEHLNRLRPARLFILGGSAVVSDDAVRQARNAMGLP